MLKQCSCKPSSVTGHLFMFYHIPIFPSCFLSYLFIPRTWIFSGHWQITTIIQSEALEPVMWLPGNIAQKASPCFIGLWAVNWQWRLPVRSAGVLAAMADNVSHTVLPPSLKSARKRWRDAGGIMRPQLPGEQQGSAALSTPQTAHEAGMSAHSFLPSCLHPRPGESVSPPPSEHVSCRLLECEHG